MKLKGLMILAALGAFAIGTAAQVVVTPDNQQGWTTADTRPGGTVTFVNDSTAPLGIGALELTTDNTTTAKAQYMHAANDPLSSISSLSYWTRQISASFPQGDASYQLPVCLGGIVEGVCVGFTTLVYEPYEQQNVAVVQNGVWQQWDAFAGQWWSSRTYTDGGTCSVTAGAGGPPFYTISGLAAVCPNATVAGYGVNVGSNNPGYDIYVDALNYNGTVYDFEPFAVAESRDQCKDGGWQNFRRADGSGFKNQGDCIQFVNTGK